MKSLLVTFGCSWTFGVGAGYQQGMSNLEYKNIAWDHELSGRLSFRGILSEQLGLDNINFAQGGSSNQKQFRLAKNFFPTAKLHDYSNVIVLWAITSTARNEIYSVEDNELVNFKYDLSPVKIAKALKKWSYDHDHEVSQLATEMLFWNDYFQSKNIKNLWIDTFNHHNYLRPIPGLVGDATCPRDLLSRLAMINGMSNPDNNYHLSSWTEDTNKIPFLVSKGVLNPISNHPTSLGHQQIAQLLQRDVTNLL